MSNTEPVMFPIDLSSELPDSVFIDGHRARWIQPSIADAGGRGVVEVHDLLGGVQWNELADTKAAAVELLGDIDWDALLEEPDDGDRPWLPSQEELRGAL